MSTVCQLKFSKLNKLTNWGYITEIADTVQHGDISLHIIQNLVDSIYKKCGLKFWDCHYDNIGLVKRNRKQQLVCIDTGKESFSGLCNAWGFSDPGPRCNYCFKYQCRCEE
jgi:hypothetical protein